MQRKLAFLVAFTVVAVSLSVFFGADKSLNEWGFYVHWSWLLGLIAGCSLVIYALSIRCPNPLCRRLQVFKSWSFFDIRWPSENCYFCRAQLETRRD
jgi:hypothetical protein